MIHILNGWCPRGGMTNRFSRVCFEESLKFANKRKTFGKKLVDHPVIRWKLAEMARQVEGCHAWLETMFILTPR